MLHCSQRTANSESVGIVWYKGFESSEGPDNCICSVQEHLS